MTDAVVIVSGLHRSGTSMMMRMLEAGGAPVLFDAAVPPGPRNPHGFYEYGPSRAWGCGQTDDTGWLTAAAGRTVKVFAHNLSRLPDGYQYHVVFMRRPMCEVVRSISGLGYDPTVEATCEARLSAGLGAVDMRPDLRTSQVEYHEILRDPITVATQIADFLPWLRLNVAAMAHVPDLNLCHHREAN